MLRNILQLNNPTSSDSVQSGRGVRGRVFAAGVVPHSRIAPRRVRDVYMSAPVHITGATLATRAPCAIE